jgi:Fe-S-cluster-containing dehydrogenase component/anaerobic selenocysteine-containing dehydrogenase
MSSLNDEPRYWRTLNEYESPPQPEEQKPEFGDLAQAPSGEERRRFLKLTAASVALAGTSACRWHEDKLLPHTRQPEGVTPGVPRHFMTGMELGGAGVGLRVKSYDGRPIKVDGNPNHPDSLGAANAMHQGAILGLYDPDRSSGYARVDQGARTGASEAQFRAAAEARFAQLKSKRGQGLYVLAGTSSSLSLADMKARWLAVFPESRWFEYEPAVSSNEHLGSMLAFGAPVATHLRLERARLIVSLDADLIGSRPDSLALARAWAAGREPESGKMNRVYAFESSLTDTGAIADHRFSLRSEHIKALVALLDAELSQRLGAPAAFGAAQPRPNARFLEDASLRKFINALLGDLADSRGESVLVAGPQQPPEVHAVVHRLNALLGNVGKTVEYSAPLASSATPSVEAIHQLTQDMAGGKVDTLLILDSNPVYTAPADAPFAAALANVPAKICLGLYWDETARKCDWHVPLAHFLETWGDVRGTDGTLTVQQPLIEPLYDGKSTIELLALLSGDERTSGLEIVQRTLGKVASDQRLWRKSLNDGVVVGSALPQATPSLRPLVPFVYSAGELSGMEVEQDQIELVLAPDPKLYDGRFSNNGWLMELPDPATKLTWDNALLIGPKTAQLLGIQDNMLVSVSIDGRTLTAPARLAPGQAPGSVKLYFGYGRTAAGRIGGEVEGLDPGPIPGVNAYLLRSKRVWDFASGAKLTPTGDTYKLSATQDKHSIDRIGKFGTLDRLPMLVREATLEEYQEHPDFVRHAVHHPPLLSLWKEPEKVEPHRWALSIDLNKCTGCSACVVACQAENNIPVVGKEAVYRGREMQWLRIDRYFKGDAEQPETVNQPVPCMQCEHAPCEQVCPVGATQHSHEGLNDMTYNRCIGTRYCGNNCPYKVRKFNFFNFHEDLKEERNQVQQMMYNPDVTVRFRGVMEKCTYCVQRIQAGKFRAARENRPVADQEITTACQDSCPTRAIVFGNWADPNSEVAKRKANSRDYSLLEELNVRPRTTYLARVRNPHPELG